MRNNNGDVKCSRIFERFKITNITQPFEIIPRMAHIMAPMPPIIELTGSILTSIVPKI